MASRHAPVKHTCPDIDSIKSRIEDIILAMETTEFSPETEESVRDWIHELKSIGMGNRCELEELRESNNALREWGHENADYIEKIDMENYSLQNDISDRDSRIEDLEKEIETLERVLTAPVGNRE